MAINSLFPGFIKLRYESLAHPHVMIIPAKPQDVGGSWLFEEKGGNLTDALEAAVTALITVMKPFLHTGSTFLDAELWTLASATADPQFREIVELNISGTHATVPVPRSQIVFTYRTQGGGLYRQYIMEGSIATDQVLTPPFGASYAALINYVTGNDSIIAGRDGTFCASCVRVITKENDALRKKYLLNV